MRVLKKWIWNAALAGLIAAAAGAGISSTAAAQGGMMHGMSGGHQGWPDSLEVITLTGTVIVDSSVMHPVYYLDTDGDGIGDVRLMFGPHWYQPPGGAVRPASGDTVEVSGQRVDEGLLPVLIVFTVNGQKWREPIEVTEHGWHPMGFWADSLQTVEVSGWVLVDTTYFYPHYFLDTDGDTLADYLLIFGPPWYQPESGLKRPTAGDSITIRGGVHTGMLGFSAIMVYELNGQTWRPAYGAPPWAGAWVHRSAGDTTWVVCSLDSLSRIGFAPGAMMGGMMGQPGFPDSVFVQFEQVHPMFLPAGPDSMFVMGFYLNLYDPSGSRMMFAGGGMGMHHGMMRFNRALQLQFHYDPDEIRQMGWGEHTIRVMAWDEESNRWVPIQSAEVDTSRDVVTVTTADLYSYFALAGEPIATGVDSPGPSAPVAITFRLEEVFPNPLDLRNTPQGLVLQFRLAETAPVVLSIYDILGRLVQKINLGTLASGVHRYQWHGLDRSGRNVASGVYFLILKSRNDLQKVKITVVR